ncbi:biotin transporter BioY [Stappia stellulata]|uniref:biotin transporter BioY n=1 Tax=Stappia stellulata TaxID=71235 RepID=UPI000414869E|nr:biotin transporter BioY [Stappia stellulata]
MSVGRCILSIAFFTFLIAVLGVLPTLALPFWGGVPITLQTIGIMLAGVVLGPVWGTLSALFFLVLVALGMPLLPGGRGGVEAFMGPSSGFLIGFPFATFACGIVMQFLQSSPVFPASLASALVGGIGVIYAFGIPGIVFFGEVPIEKAMLVSLVYLPGDLIKAFVVALIAKAIARGRPDALLSRQ